MKRTQKATRPPRLKRTIRRHLKLAFVPHGANQFRPHAVRRYGLVAFLLLVIGVQAVYNVTATGTVLGARTSITSQELLQDTNAERERHGLEPLRLNAKLSKAAALKAKDMFARQYWAHVAPNGTTPWHWLEMAGYEYTVAGENLARGFSSADAAMTAWMSSPDHRRNILGEKYGDAGFAVVSGMLDGQPTTLVVALYGQEAAAPVAAVGAVAPMVTPASQTISPMARLGVALQSMTPAAVASVLLLTVLAAVALTAHVYRRKLPKSLRQSWYRHHGLLKAGGMVSLVVLVIILYSGGQI